MTLPARLLEQLSPAFLEQGRQLLEKKLGPAEPGLALGIEALDTELPDHGLLRGGVVELCVSGPSGCGVSLSLAACRATQKEAELRGAPTAWCAYVDPTATLYAPGVAAAGVTLERLLVVRPEAEAISRVALRLVEAQAFALVVIDTVGPVGQRLKVDLGTWPRVVRRLSMALEGRSDTVLLITSAEAHRPLPLPVAQRLELRHTREQEILLRVAKDQRGRITSPRPIVWARAGRRSTVTENHGRRTG